MVKKLRLSIAILSLFSFGIYAQNATISPYSLFGIGDLRDMGTVENQMMGGLRLYADSIHVNLRNPAAYSSLRLTTYAAGISHREYRLVDLDEEQNVSSTNLDYIAIGLPLGNDLGVGFGLMPLSSVGYNLLQERTGDEGQQISNLYTGDGGVNRVYFSMGYKPVENVSLGATINYNFGTLEYRRVQSVGNVQFGTIDDRRSKINGFDFNYAVNYTPKLNDKLTLFSHFGANTQINLVSENEQSIGSFSTSTGRDIEVFDVDLGAIALKNTEIKIPTTFTLGAGLGADKKWFLGAEYGMQETSTFQNQFLRIGNVSYNDSKYLSLGGFFVPDYTSFSNIFERITYRAGFRYDQTGLVVNGEEINNFGITFGVGLPMSGIGVDRFSNLNIGFEWGKRGTTDASLIEENYFKVNIGLSLNAKWFRKRQID